MIRRPEVLAPELIEAWRFLARRYGLEPVANERAILAAVEHARALATRDEDEPAALFYAFACRPKAFAGGWRRMTIALAVNQAAEGGWEITATDEEIADMRHRIARSDRPSFDEVRDWFAARTRSR